VNHFITGELSLRLKRQALPGELIDYNEDPVCATIMGALMYEIITPYMIPPNRPQANARRNASAIIYASSVASAALSLLVPDPLHSLAIYLPALKT
jgi:hypothetical protein